MMKTCIICGTRFTPRTSRQLCCCHDCSIERKRQTDAESQQRRSARKDDPVKHRPRKCVVCKAQFTPAARHHVVCSAPCRAKLKRTRDAKHQRNRTKRSQEGNQ